MKLITITQIQYLNEYFLEISFSDTCIKQFDFSQLIDFKGISLALKDKNYFKTATISEQGRVLAWENGYDCCADWLRYYAKDTNNEWETVDENLSLKQRMNLSLQKMKRSS